MTSMKLFLISQDEHDDYDSFDSAVVAAPDEESARLMDPGGENGAFIEFSSDGYRTWCSSADKVTVKFLGDAAPGLPLGVVCASFNAG
jgi:hypothetical protein